MHFERTFLFSWVLGAGLEHLHLFYCTNSTYSLQVTYVTLPGILLSTNEAASGILIGDK